MTVDTSSLPISDAAWHADLLIDSNATPEAVPVPVRVKVSGEPSGLNRYGLRPLSSAAVAGLCGGLIGALLGAVGGLGAPVAVNSPALFWALVIGGIWAAFGLVRGLGQRPAWTTTYALVRYLTKIGLWVAWVWPSRRCWACWSGTCLSNQDGPALVSNAGLRLVLIVTALAIVPATVSEIRAARQASDSPLAGERRSLLQPALVAVAGIALVAVLAAGVRLAGPTWTQLTEAGTVELGAELDRGPPAGAGQQRTGSGEPGDPVDERPAGRHPAGRDANSAGCTGSRGHTVTILTSRSLVRESTRLKRRRASWRLLLVDSAHLWAYTGM